MNVSGYLSKFSGKLLLSCAFLVLVGTSGCTRRYRVTNAELNKVQTNKEELGVLRVYPSKRIISIYDEAERDQSLKIDEKIRENYSEGRREVKVTRNTRGQIIKVDELNGAKLLWVAFSPNCKAEKCAYGFVEMEDGNHYKLMSVPEKAGYQEPRVYHRWATKRQLMKPGKIASFSEANDVLRVKRKSGKVRSIDLIVKKVVRRVGQTRRESEQGVD